MKRDNIRKMNTLVFLFFLLLLLSLPFVSPIRHREMESFTLSHHSHLLIGRINFVVVAIAVPVVRYFYVENLSEKKKHERTNERTNEAMNKEEKEENE